MALKQSSSFASLRSKFRKSSSSSVKGQDEDAHSPGSLSRAPTNHSTASSSASKRPGLFRSFSSSSGKDGNNSSSSTNGNGNSANRWADAPPLPAPSNKSTKPEKLPLGYVPPASPGSMSSPRSEGPPFSGKAGPSSPNTLAPRQHLSAAEQGANLRHRSQSQGASTMESMQRRSQYITQGAPPLPGQRTSASQPVTPPAANARARTQSSSQGAKERPRSVSASNPSQKSRDQPKDAAAKLKNRVSITPGKDSWAQVQAREQRAKYSSQYGAPPPSEDQKRYTGYGSGSLAPERANSQSSRYSYAAPSSSSPYRQSSIQSASSNPHHPDQMLYNHNAAAGGQRQMDGPPGPRTRSMYAGNHPGQLSPAGLSPTSPQMVKYPHPPSALLSPGGPSPHLLPHGGANAAVDSPSTLGDPTSPGSTVSPIRSVSDSVFPDPPSHVPSSQASNAETIMSPVHSVSSPATSVFPPEPLLAPFSPLQPRSSPIFAILPPAFPPRPISQCYASCYCEENAYRLVQALLQRPPFSTGLSVASHLSDGLGLTGADPNPSDATLNADRVLDTMYQHAGLRWAVHVIFASNEGQNVALFAQRAGAEAGRGDGLVIWDYHVFVAVTAYMTIDNMAPASELTSSPFKDALSHSHLVGGNPGASSSTSDDRATRRHSAHVSRTWIYDFDSSLGYPPEFTMPYPNGSGPKRNGPGPDGLPTPAPVPLEMYALATLRLNLFQSSTDPAGGQSGPRLPLNLRPKFRVIPAQQFLENFASDRRHMRQAGPGLDPQTNSLQVPVRSRRGTVPGSPDGGVAAVEVGSAPGSPMSPSTPVSPGAGSDNKEELWTKPPPQWPLIVGPAASQRGEVHNLFDRYVPMDAASIVASMVTDTEDDHKAYGVVLDADSFVSALWTGAVPAVASNIAVDPRVQKASANGHPSYGPPAQGGHPHPGSRPRMNPQQAPAYPYRPPPNAQPQYHPNPYQNHSAPVSPVDLPSAHDGATDALLNRRTWVSRPPPPVPDGPGFVPDPRDPEYVTMIGEYYESYASSAYGHHQPRGMPNGSGAAGVGANGNANIGHGARRGGRIESPYFAAYLQASYEARATVQSPQSPAMEMGAGSMSLLGSNY